MRRRRWGMSLIELIVTIGIMSFVMLGAFQVFNEGMQLFRTNQRAVEAQSSVLKLLSSINLELTNADRTLVRDPATSGTLPGVLFASPVSEDGEIKFDDETGRVYWQKIICYYFLESERKVYRREIPVTPEASGVKGSTSLTDVRAQLQAQTTDIFAAASNRPTRLLATDISRLTIAEYSGELTGGSGIGAGGGGGSVPGPGRSYDVTVEAGDKDDRGPSGYYIKVSSRVSPRG